MNARGSPRWIIATSGSRLARLARICHDDRRHGGHHDNVNAAYSALGAAEDPDPKGEEQRLERDAFVERGFVTILSVCLSPWMKVQW